MYCPESVIHNGNYLWVCHYGHGDVSWKLRPLAERWNPLRYEIGIRTDPKGAPRVYLNRRGRLATKWSNLTWRLYRRRRWERERHARTFAELGITGGADRRFRAKFKKDR